MKRSILISAFSLLSTFVPSFLSHAQTPVDLRTWAQEGIPGNGNWVVAEDGSSVVQTVNQGPTFFVSPEVVTNTVIRGTLNVETANDDDFIGFVFGYQSPLAENGDLDNDYEFLLFDWKQVQQAFGGRTAEEGFSLVGVNAIIEDLNPEFWAHTSSDSFEVLATDFGAGKGWQDNTDYSFELVYESNRIVITIDGEQIFDVSGSFPEGRFGFYNYSQRDVRYRSLTADPANRAPVVRGPTARSAFVGQPLEFSFSVSDPDDDTLFLTYLDHPTGATIIDPGTATKFFRWQPAIHDVGTHFPGFVASDGFLADTLQVQIEVSPPAAPILQSLEPASGRVGDLVTLRGLAFGDGPATIIFNGTPTSALSTTDTVATAIVPASAASGPLTLFSSAGAASNTKQFTVLPPPTVNLVAKALFASTPVTVTQGIVPLAAKVQNLGAFPATANISFYDNHPDSGGSLITTTPFDIGAQRQKEIASEWVPASPGLFRPFARISGANPRENKLFDNGVSNGEVTVVERSEGGEFPLIVGPPEQFMIGEPQNYSFNIVNAGSETSEITGIQIAGPAGFVPATSLPFILPPGASASFTFSVTLPEGTPTGPQSGAATLTTARANDFTGDFSFFVTETPPFISVRLLNDSNGLPVSGARVFYNEIQQDVTDGNGIVQVVPGPGKAVQVVFFKEEFLPRQVEISLEDGDDQAVFITPGEILITDIEVEPLSPEEIEELGLDLDDPENFNYQRFTATIQASPDEPPMEVSWIENSSDSGRDRDSPERNKPCGIDAEVARHGQELLFRPEYEDCGSRFRLINFVEFTDGRICTTSITSPICSQIRNFVGRVIEPCTGQIVEEETVIQEFFVPGMGEVPCRQTILHTCSNLKNCRACLGHPLYGCEREDDEEEAVSTGPTLEGGAMEPVPEVTIPYVLVIDGAVRTLKDFFNVTLVLGNHADPGFTVENLQVELLSGPLTVVKDAEPLENIAGGQSTSTTWVIRGDEPGAHLIQVNISGALQPGNIALSALQTTTVIVEEPPPLELVLQHPDEVTDGQSFTLSAVVRNASERQIAREAGIEMFASGTVEMLSESLQSLGDIPPGGTAVASWQLVARGEGKVQGCAQSSDSGLDFTLLIGDTPCGDVVPSETQEDDAVPPGNVVILGADVPFPDVNLWTIGQDPDSGLPLLVTATSDETGAYAFQRRIFGEELTFELLVPNVDPFRKMVRPRNLQLLRSVPLDADTLPTLAVGAENKFDDLTSIIADILNTSSANEFFNVMNRHYQLSESELQGLLAEKQVEGRWGEGLNQTREEFYRLFLAQELLSRARTEATVLARVASSATVDFIFAIFNIVDQVRNFRSLFPRATLLQQFFYEIELTLLSLQDDILEILTVSISFSATTVTSIPLPLVLDLQDELLGLLADIGQFAVSGKLNETPNFKEDIAKALLSIYAKFFTAWQIDEMTHRFNLYDSGNVTPLDIESLSLAQQQVQNIRGLMISDAARILQESAILQLLAEELGKVNLGLSGIVATSAVTGVGAPLAAAIKVLQQVPAAVESYWSVEAFRRPVMQLYSAVPNSINDGIVDAFEPGSSVSAVREGSDGIAITAAKSSPALRKSAQKRQFISEAFESYNQAIDRLRGLIEDDSTDLAVETYTGRFIPANRGLTKVLDQSSALVSGGAGNSFSSADPEAEAIFDTYYRGIISFKSSRLPFPWQMLNYADVNEFGGGISNPGYQDFKNDLLTTLDDLALHSGDLEPIVNSTLDHYAQQGFIQSTAAIDSVFFQVDGIESGDISNLPAEIIASAKIQNLSGEPINGLTIVLRPGNADGLSFTGPDSISLPELAADDNLPGGADEFIAEWSLVYQGSLTEQSHIAFTSELHADSIDIHTGNPQTVFMGLVAPDADKDGMPDDYESSVDLDPARDDASEDPDRDTLVNLREFLLRTDPHNPDTDGDGIFDSVELADGSDPFNSESPIQLNNSALILPLSTQFETEDRITLPLKVSSGSEVTGLQFTIEYDSTLLTFERVTRDSSLLFFEIDEVSSSPGFMPENPAANKNLLVRISSPNSAVSGKNISIAILEFTIAGEIDSSTTIAFDRNDEHTFLKDQDNLNLSIVSFTDAIITMSRPTAVAEPTAQIPESFALEQNYPNPFNPTTTIRYQLPMATDVKLVIYNILGQTVRTLVDTKHIAGFHTIEWNGKNDQDRQIASGVYIYRLTAGDFVQAKKMILLR